MPPLIKIDYGQSKGSYAFDLKKQRLYLDMVNHYSSLPLGYNHPVFHSNNFHQEVLRTAGIKTSLGLYDSAEYQCFLKEFKEFACPPGFNHVHFACTGSLAVEAAVKTAWVHILDRDKKKETTSKLAHTMPSPVYALEGSFHGINSFGNFLSTSDRGFKILAVEDESPYDILMVCGKCSNDAIDIMDEENTFKNCAGILIEPIQCSNGDIYLDPKILNKLRRICTKNSIPLIFDEIQTGFGTTGKTWHYQHLGVEPDIIIFGKKAQVSAIMVKDGFAAIFKHPEKLSVTFDGDLIDMIRCRYIMETIKKDHLMDNITLHGENIRAVLDMIPQLNDVRGVGGLIAFDMDTEHERDRFCEKAFENGLLVNPTGELSVRMRPNLAITTQEAFTCTEIIKKTIFELYL